MYTFPLYPEGPQRKPTHPAKNESGVSEFNMLL